MKKLLISILLILSTSIFSQAPKENKNIFGELRAITIDFGQFAKGEYSKLSEVSSKKSNERVGVKIEQLEAETEAALELPWLKQKSLEIMDNVNVANFIRNQYRWLLVNSKDDPELALDLVSQHIITHSLEVFGGPALTASYAMSGGDPLIASIMGVASVVIAVPGLDPLCILGFMTYRYVPIYRTAFRATRMTLFMLPKFALGKLGVKEKMAWLLGRSDRRDFVKKALQSENLKVTHGPKVSESGSDFIVDFKFEQSQITLDFEYNSDKKGLFLRSLVLEGDVLSHSQESYKKLGADLKRIYGWNVAQGVTQSLKRLKKEKLFGASSVDVLNSTYYIEQVRTSPEATVIEFFKNSLESNGKNNLITKMKEKCNRLFQI